MENKIEKIMGSMVEKIGDITFYTHEGIRYCDQPGILYICSYASIDYEQTPTFKMDKVDKVLNQLGATQTELAEEMGTTRQTITNYKNRRNLREETIFAIRMALYRLTAIKTEGKLFLSMGIEELFYLS